MIYSIFSGISALVFVLILIHIIRWGIEEEQKIAIKRWQSKEFSYREAQLLREAGYPV